MEINPSEVPKILKEQIKKISTINGRKLKWQ